MADKIDSFLDQFDPQSQTAGAASERVNDAPAQKESPDDDMKYLAKLARAIYGAGAGPGADLFSKTDLASVGRGIKRTREAPDASMSQEISNIAGRSVVPMIAGAATGAALGPVGAGAGAMRGVAMTAGAEALAGLAGELAGQGVARVAGNKQAISGSEAGAQAALSGVLGGAARGGAEVVVRGIPKAKAAAKGVVSLASKYGVDLTPAEITASKALSGLESWLEKTMLGSGPISARREANAEALKAAKDKFMARAGTDKERQAIGLSFFDMVKGRAEGFNNAVREVYKRAFDTVPQGEKVQISNFMDTAERLAGRSKKSPFGGGGAGATGDKVVDFFDGGFTYRVPGTAGIPEPKPRYTPTIKGQPDIQDMQTGGITKGYADIPGYQIPEPAANPYGTDLPQLPTKSRSVNTGGRDIDLVTGKALPVRMTPQDMIEMRTDLTQAIADNDAGLKIGIRTMSSRQAGAYKMLLSALEKDMDAYAAGSKVSGDFVTKYRAAKGLAKQNYDIFNNPNVVGLLKRNPEAVTSVIGRDSVTEIQAIKKAAGDKGFDQIRRIWLTELLKEERKSTGKSLANALANDYTPDTLREVFKTDPKALSELQEIAELQARIGMVERSTPMTGSARAAAQGFASTIGSMVGGALGSVAGAGGAAVGAGTGAMAGVILPYKAAQVYLSPQARKIVLDGLRAPAGSRAKAIAAARLAAFLSKATVSPGSEGK